MATQYTCDRCGKRLTYEEHARSMAQVRYRKSHSAMAWESKWYDLCDGCVTDFGNWLRMESKKDSKGGKKNE